MSPWCHSRRYHSLHYSANTLSKSLPRDFTLAIPATLDGHKVQSLIFLPMRPSSTRYLKPLHIHTHSHTAPCPCLPPSLPHRSLSCCTPSTALTTIRHTIVHSYFSSSKMNLHEEWVSDGSVTPTPLAKHLTYWHILAPKELINKWMKK